MPGRRGGGSRPRRRGGRARPRAGGGAQRGELQDAGEAPGARARRRPPHDHAACGQGGSLPRLRPAGRAGRSGGARGLGGGAARRRRRQAHGALPPRPPGAAPAARPRPRRRQAEETGRRAALGRTAARHGPERAAGSGGAEGNGTFRRSRPAEQREPLRGLREGAALRGAHAGRRRLPPARHGERPLPAARRQERRPAHGRGPRALAPRAPPPRVSLRRASRAALCRRRFEPPHGRAPRGRTGRRPATPPRWAWGPSPGFRPASSSGRRSPADRRRPSPP